jgi:hypothetical protein
MPEQPGDHHDVPDGVGGDAQEPAAPPEVPSGARPEAEPEAVDPGAADPASGGGAGAAHGATGGGRGPKLELTGSAGDATPRQAEGGDGLVLDVGSGSTLTLVATATPPPPTIAAEDAEWTLDGGPATTGSADATEASWTYVVDHVEDSSAGEWAVRVGGDTATLSVAVAGPPEEGDAPVVVEAAVGEYDEKVAARATGVAVAAFLVLVGLIVFAALRLPAAGTNGRTAAVDGFLLVALTLVGVCAVLVVAAAWSGTLETRGRLRAPVRRTTDGDRDERAHEGEQALGGEAIDIGKDLGEVGKEFVKQLVVMRSTVAMLAVALGLGMTVVIASCNVATTAVTPSPTTTTSGDGSTGDATGGTSSGAPATGASTSGTPTRSTG